MKAVTDERGLTLTCCYSSAGGRVGGMVYNSQGLIQTQAQPPEPATGHGHPLDLVNDGGPRRGTFHFLDCSSSKDHFGPRFHRRLCWCLWSVMLPQAAMKPEVHVVLGICAVA